MRARDAAVSAVSEPEKNADRTRSSNMAPIVRAISVVSVIKIDQLDILKELLNTDRAERMVPFSTEVSTE